MQLGAAAFALGGQVRVGSVGNAVRPLPLVGSYVFSPVLEAAARVPVEMLQGVRVSVATELGVLCVAAVR